MDLQRVPAFAPRDEQEDEYRREEEHQVRRRVDDAFGAHGPALEEEIGADVRALEQREGGADHEDRAVEHVRGIEHPERGRVEHVAHDHLVADAQHHRDVEPRHPGSGHLGEPVDGAHGADECRRRRFHSLVLPRVSCPSVFPLQKLKGADRSAPSRL